MAFAIVLCFNLGFVLWAVSRHELENGRVILYAGGCDKARIMRTGFYLVINCLATTLLAASNCAMARRPLIFVNVGD